MSQVDKDYEDEYLNGSWKHGEEQVVKKIAVERKHVPVDKRFHSRSNHDFYMKRFCHCPYCEQGCIITEDEKI